MRSIVDVVLDNSTALLHEMDRNPAVVEILTRKLTHEYEATLAAQNERIRHLEYENNCQKGAIRGYEYAEILTRKLMHQYEATIAAQNERIRHLEYENTFQKGAIRGYKSSIQVILEARYETMKAAMTDSMGSFSRILHIDALHAKAFDAHALDDLTFDDGELDSIDSDSTSAFDAFDTFDSSVFDAFESQPLDAFNANDFDAVNVSDAAHTEADMGAFCRPRKQRLFQLTRSTIPDVLRDFHTQLAEDTTTRPICRLPANVKDTPPKSRIRHAQQREVGHTAAL
jgi:hypothetical protein